MKLAIIGNGKMGKEVEKLAKEQSWEVCAIINNEDGWNTPDPLNGADVAVEFTAPKSVILNLERCFQAGVPVVTGTTGWYFDLEKARTTCLAMKGTFLYAPNFSKGINILFALNNWLSGIMDGNPEYDVSVTEFHHAHKLDAPSGTAIRMAEGILKFLGRKKEWVKGRAENDDQIGITSWRNGEIPGIHTLQWDSFDDSIRIIHQVKHRRVFASGALEAAGWLIGKEGVFTYEDMLFESV